MEKEILFTKTYSSDETEKTGSYLAKLMTDTKDLPSFVAMYGDLGSGKTAFVRGFTSVISPKSTVKSPTFTIVNEYRGGKIPVFHFDMYRIESEDDLYSIGFYDYLENGFCLCEWSENIEFAFPCEYIKVDIERVSVDAPDERNIRISLINQITF